MEPRKKNFKQYNILLIFLLVAASVLILICMQRADMRERRERVAAIDKTFADKIEYNMESLLYSTRTLEALVVQGGGEIGDFEEIAAEFVRDMPIKNIALAPGGVVAQVYPAEGNREAIGHDLFRDEDRVTEAVMARDTGELTLAGPFELIQGGFAAVGRRPVYLKNGDGSESFWGLVCVAMEFPRALEDVRLETLKGMGLEYRLWRIHPDTGEKQIIDGSQNDVRDPVEVSIQVPNAQWILSVSPTKGWIDLHSLLAQTAAAVIIDILGILLVLNVVKLAEQKQKMEMLSMTDPLTGLLNRRAMEDRLESLIRANSGGDGFAICYMDLNGFKQVNDTQGHDVGDKLLTEVANRLRSVTGGPETVARVGGDEFIFLLPDVADGKGVDEFEKKVRDILEKDIEIGDVTLRTSASMGAALYPSDGDSAEELLQASDRAMYAQKAAAQGSQKKGSQAWEGGSSWE